jgi:dual specificity MAP kinase phosphatase
MNRKRKSYPNEILPGKLYLGDRLDAHDINVLNNLHITHIVNVTPEIPNYHEKEGKKGVSISYMRVSVEDHEEAMINHYFLQVFNYMDSAIFSSQDYEKENAGWRVTSFKSNNEEPRNKSEEEISREFELLTKSNKNRVLVHCAMGVSRSVSIVIMYLMKRFNTTFESVSYLY